MPESARATIAMGRLTEKPQRRLVNMVLKRHMRTAGFRPMRSESLPQRTPVTLWLREKTADVIPAHLAISLCSTPKYSIISGRYGKMDVIAMGSESRHSAVIVSQFVLPERWWPKTRNIKERMSLHSMTSWLTGSFLLAILCCNGTAL